MKTRKIEIARSTEVRLPAKGREIIREESGQPIGKRPVFFVLLHPTGEVEIRPKGTRDPEAKVVVSIEGIYQQALIRKARAASTRRAPVKRGLLHLERRRESL